MNLKFYRDQDLPSFYPLVALFLLIIFGAVNYSLKSMYQTANKPDFFANLPEMREVQSAKRGIPGDYWADIILGKRDFTEISPGKVVADKVASPGGVVVDQSVGEAGFAYIWDSGNSRIIGMNLAECYRTMENDSTKRCSASLVIGQESIEDHGACNRDSSFQSYPGRAPSSASTLCGVPEWTHTALEHKSLSSMYINERGDLYVPDVMNNRILKYISPLKTDTISDEVWGQPDFSGNLCNQGGGFEKPDVEPTAESLCFTTPFSNGSGVTFDLTGNMWVADGGNNRVLRFPLEPGSSKISKIADIVIGQPDFTTGAGSPSGPAVEVQKDPQGEILKALNRLKSPSSIGFDQYGVLYVADKGNNRIVKYYPPFSSNMNGKIFLDSTNFEGTLETLQVENNGRYIWTTINVGHESYYYKWDLYGRLINDPFMYSGGGGSIGFDRYKNLIISTYKISNVVKLSYDTNTEKYYRVFDFFKTPLGQPTTHNIMSSDRLAQGGWGGLGVLSNSQLIITDGRLMYWNNPLQKNNGAEPDGFVGATSPIDASKAYKILTTDKDDRVYVESFANKIIEIYQGPLSSTSTPIAIIKPPFKVFGGGQIDYGSNEALKGYLSGMAATSHGEYLWLSDAENNRAFRIKDPLTNPLVDIILGQYLTSGKKCNQGIYPPPNSGDKNAYADYTMLCHPGPIKFDNYNNLYISDHFFEAEGNYRLLMFRSHLFDRQPKPESVILAPEATKEFPRQGVQGSTINHATFEVAFSWANIMVAGNNPYMGHRFLDYYLHPSGLDPANPSGTEFTTPDGSLKDFYGWPFALSFDKDDNLYVYDTNRGRVMIYFKPFENTSLFE